ncbi:hypothetical protein [Rhizobium binxianense]
MGTTGPMMDHSRIRKWIEARGGHPARVLGTGKQAVRIDFGKSLGSSEDISWEEFFRAFDDSKLAFLHRDKATDSRSRH